MTRDSPNTSPAKPLVSYKMPSQRPELFAPPPPSASKPSAASMDASSFPLIGDYIGVESCLDYAEPPDRGSARGGGESDRRWRWDPKGKRRGERERKEYPPPIPLLARTGNLHCHMPWVLRRQYTSDGRLILTEEKVRHHEYFRARRANGRLTLQLVPLDGDDPCLPTIADDVEEEDEEDEDEDEEILNPKGAGTTIADDLKSSDVGQDDVGSHGGEEEDCAQLAASIAELTVESGGGGGIGGNGAGKCSNYNGISASPSSSCIFGVRVPVPVPALRPVHS